MRSALTSYDPTCNHEEGEVLKRTLQVLKKKKMNVKSKGHYRDSVVSSM